jgi:hypothetical protein
MKLPTMMNPLAVARAALGLAGSAVTFVDTVTRGTARVVGSTLHHLGRTEAHDAEDPTDDTGPTRAAGGTKAVTDVARPPKGPTIVPNEPHVPEQPPVDVVEQALAQEAALGGREAPEGAGLAHEPRGASRGDEHGDTAVPRAEADGIADEVAATFEDDDAPAPDDHLTQPLIDPGEAKALAAEMQTLRRAADPHKE